MSTRSTIGYVSGKVHLYEETLDFSVWMDRKTFPSDESIRLFSDDEWREIHKQIIQKLLQKLANGNLQDAYLPESVWDRDGWEADKNRIMKNFAIMMDKIK